MTIRSLLDDLRRHPEVSDALGSGAFRLVSSLEPPASRDEIAAALPAPDDVVELWEAARSARLFEDAEYGQWGLHLLSPSESSAVSSRERRERPGDSAESDVVIGAFLGDLELLVRSSDGVRVALPLDPRAAWPLVGRDVHEFLSRYIAGSGERFWPA